MNVSSNNISLVVKELDAMDARIMQAAEVGLRRGLLGAVGIIQRQFLSGPRPSKLDVRTARLRNSISSDVESGPDGRIVGRVGTNVAYGAFHEFGFRGVQNVKAHTRVISQVDRFGAEIDSRRVLRDRKKNFVGFKDTRKQAASRMKSGFVFVQFVRAHSRRVNYKGRPFVRPGVEQALPMVLSEIRKEIKSETAK
jgi:phage gpG-like protein